MAANTSIQFQSVINITSQPSQFLNKCYVEKNELTLEISNNFFIELNVFKHEYPEFTLIDFVSTQLDYVGLKKSKRLEGRLSRILGEVTSEFKKYNASKGSEQREAYKNKIRNISVRKDEIENVKDMTLRLDSCKRELIETRKLCIKTYEELLKVKSAVRNQAVEIGKLKDENKELMEYLNTKYPDGVPKSAKDLPTNSGQTYDSVERQQKNRKLVSLQKDASSALWFAKTYGLVPTTLTLESNAGEEVKIPMNGPTAKKAPTSFSELPEDDQRKIQQLAYILDHFGVSDTFYHELHMLIDGVPDSKLIAQGRTDMSKIFEIHRVPGGKDGAFISFKGELMRLANVNNIEDLPRSTKVAFGGDGAQMSKVSSFVNFSFRLIDEHASPQKTVAIIKCPEKYEDLETTCAPLLKEVNECVEADVVQLFLTGDKKFKNLIIGLPVGFGSAIYCCSHCKVSKDDLKRINLPWDHYHQPDMARTMDNMTIGAFGVMRKPLLRIPIQNIILCALHSRLRTTDVLQENVVNECKQLDHEARVNKLPQTHIKRLVELINESVHFTISEKTEHGKTSLSWTSLTGDAKLKLLKELPDKLRPLLHQETVETVIKIWKDLEILLAMMEKPDVDDPDFHLKFFRAAHAWLELFLSLAAKRIGYNRTTWYMHDLVYHVPFLLKQHKSLEFFSGQTLEKNNDVIKMVHMRKSKRWDACMEALQIKKRIEVGEEMELGRVPRPYKKRKLEYWTKDIYTQRHNLRENIKIDIASKATLQQESQDKENVEALSVPEIKQLLAALNVPTKRIRSKKRLLKLYADAIAP